MLDEETSEEVEEDGTDTSMKRSRLSGRRARKRKEQGGGKIKEENDSQLLTNSFSQKNKKEKGKKKCIKTSMSSLKIGGN
uniref:Uncharacterized protein n=1 Tax=Vitis vinifera TaxID=29760 RepID=F6GWS3_VITVI